MVELAKKKGDADEFLPAALRGDGDGARGTLARKEVGKSRNNELRELFNGGFGTHHAGMLPLEKCLVETLFQAGLVKVQPLGSFEGLL